MTMTAQRIAIRAEGIGKRYRLGPSWHARNFRELLMETLGVTPGSVTALAPINDTAGRVTVVLDAWIAEQERVNCPPRTNTAPTTLKTRDLIRFLEATGHPPKLVPLEATLAGGAPAIGN